MRQRTVRMLAITGCLALSAVLVFGITLNLGLGLAWALGIGSICARLLGARWITILWFNGLTAGLIGGAGTAHPIYYPVIVSTTLGALCIAITPTEKEE